MHEIENGTMEQTSTANMDASPTLMQTTNEAANAMTAKNGNLNATDNAHETPSSKKTENANTNPAAAQTTNKIANWMTTTNENMAAPLLMQTASEPRKMLHSTTETAPQTINEGNSIMFNRKAHICGKRKSARKTGQLGMQIRIT